MTNATIFSQSLPVSTVRLARRRAARRWLRWVGIALAAILLAPTTLVLPPVWHGAVRAALALQGARHGSVWTVARVRGGLFSTTQLENLQVRTLTGNTHLSADRASFRVFASQRWLADVRLEGVRGSLDLTPTAAQGANATHSPAGLSAGWLPTDFSVGADDLCLQHGRDAVRLVDLLVTGSPSEPGTFAVREVRVEAPGFAYTLPGGRGRTFWKDGCLTFSSVSGHDDSTAVANGTLDLTRLRRGTVQWDGSLRFAEGEVRGQGALNFARLGVPLEFAATMRHTALAPLARLLGVRGPMNGQVEQGSFTFRGDPADLAAAQISLSGRATGFCWEDRRWQSLEVQAVVVHRRVQLHRLALRQDQNRLALSGEYPLPPADGKALQWTGDGSWWQAAGFTGNVDARLEDLGALVRLVGSGAPALRGRMSANGQLSAKAGSADVEGYLNVEGTGLNLRGAPLDYLRSTLLFRHGALEIADVQATQGADYFTAHGAIGLSGKNAVLSGELRAEVRDASVYLPALVDWPEVAGRVAPVRRLEAVVRLDGGELRFDRWEGEATEYLLAQ